MGTVVPSIILALIFALMLRESTRFSAFMRSALFFPTLIPLVAASALFIFIFLPDIGLLDHYLKKLGARSVNWIGDPSIALSSLIAMTVWKNAGYYMLFFLAGLQGLSKDAEEAAMIEGANLFQRIWYVILPLLGPDHCLRGGHRPHQCDHAGGPCDRHDPRGAEQLHQPPSVLHLSTGP